MTIFQKLDYDVVTRTAGVVGVGTLGIGGLMATVTPVTTAMGFTGAAIAKSVAMVATMKAAAPWVLAVGVVLLAYVGYRAYKSKNIKVEAVS